MVQLTFVQIMLNEFKQWFQTQFLKNKYEFEEFIVVADSGLMNNDNIAGLETNGYKYIIVQKSRTRAGKYRNGY